MKRIISLLFICLMCMALAVPCFAAEFKNPPVTDLTEMLDETQFENLYEKLEKTREKHGFDVAIVIEDEMSGSDVSTVACDIYENNGYGTGKNKNGILLYISYGDRKYHIVTGGSGKDIFNDDDIDRMQGDIEKYLKTNDYYLASDIFADIADEIVERGEEKNVLLIVGCAVLIPLLIAYLLMRVKLAKMNTARKNNYAANYVKEGSKRIDFSRDIYLYSNITKREKSKSNSGSHKSSSGKSYGGGGGSF